MNSRKIPTPFAHSDLKTARSGFALVIAISLMAFILLLVLGLTATLRVETTVSNQTVQMAKAQENAKTALMVALSELQKTAGPDQRVTAWSEILDTSPDDSNQISGVNANAQKMLGVWESWTTYITDPMTTDAATSGVTIDSISNTYERGRSEDLFQRWLVSHESDTSSDPDSAKLNAVTGGIDFTDTDTTVEMVATGTLGNNVNTDQHVRAGKVPIEGTNANESGAYAWWVGGDNLKAALDVTSSVDLNEDTDPLTQIQTDHTTARLNDPRGEVAGSFSSFPDDTNTREKLATIANIQGQASSPATAKENFFDFAPQTSSLLTDVRRGGTKHDLNLLFENDSFPAEFANQMNVPWDPNIEIDPTIRELNGEIENIGGTLVNPHTTLPSWNRMREYYRLYRSPDTHGLDWGGNAPHTFTKSFTRRKGPNDGKGSIIPEVAGYTRYPLILRQAYVIGLRKRLNKKSKINYDLVSVPIFAIWNPYNVELRYYAGQFTTNMKYPHIFRLNYKALDKPDGTSDTTWQQVPNQIGSLQAWAGISLFNQVGEPAGAEITLAPGEIAVYSVGSALANGENAAAYRGILNQNNAPLLGEWSNIMGGVAQADEATADNMKIALAFGVLNPNNDDANDNARQPLDRLGGSPHALLVSLADRSTQDGTTIDSVVNLDDPNTDLRGAAVTVISNWIDGGKFAGQQIIIPEDEAKTWTGGASGYTDAKFIAIVQVVAKAADQTYYDSYSQNAPSNGVDYRAKNWLHSAPIHVTNMNNLGNDVARANATYQFHYTDITGNELGNFLQIDNGSIYMGGGYDPGSGVTRMVMLELPSAPITSLSGFATMRLQPSTVQSFAASNPNAQGNYMPYFKFNGHHAASFSLGIGNGYAHTMIPEDDIVQIYGGADTALWTDTNDLLTGKATDTNNTASNIIATDYWDQLLITNDALYDNWYCSAFVPDTAQGIDLTSLDDVIDNFVDGTSKLSNQRYSFYLPKGMDVAAAKAEIKDTDGNNLDGYQKASGFMTLNGGFNINSTSIEAWKALLYGIKQRQVPYRTNSGGIGLVSQGTNEAVVSRFGWAPNNQEGSDGADVAAWTGIRKLTDDQLDKLAEKIVEQVKRRGPFLNMSEFINRRAGDSTDARLNQAGALQAAIDWDEFENDYDGTGDTGSLSINGRFKDGSSMIDSVSFDYPNPTAAKGSRFSGIPGYVMASDILRALGDILVPRDDTFTIRAYGETTDLSGNTVQAWCEARVQRIPDYVDINDKPWEQKADKLGNKLTNNSINGLSDLNKQYGRQFRILSFRWLNADEV